MCTRYIIESLCICITTIININVCTVINVSFVVLQFLLAILVTVYC